MHTAVSRTCYGVFTVRKKFGGKVDSVRRQSVTQEKGYMSEKRGEVSFAMLPTKSKTVRNNVPL